MPQFLLDRGQKIKITLPLCFMHTNFQIRDGKRVFVMTAEEIAQVLDTYREFTGLHIKADNNTEELIVEKL